MLLSAVFWRPTHYCYSSCTPHKSTDFIDWNKRSHSSKMGSKTQPDNDGIDSPTNTVWISSVQYKDRNETQKILHTCNVIPRVKKKNYTVLQ